MEGERLWTVAIITSKLHWGSWEVLINLFKLYYYFFLHAFSGGELRPFSLCDTQKTRPADSFCLNNEIKVSELAGKTHETKLYQ